MYKINTNHGVSTSKFSRYLMKNLSTPSNVLRHVALVAIALMLSFAPASAEEIASSGSVMDVIGAPAIVEDASFNETHPILRLTPDKSEIVHLDAEAASVIVGNPNHINVMLDTSRTLVVVPRQEGASHFTVIGKDGSVLMQRHAIVASPKENYVRIRRSCANSGRGSSCQETSVYFCPDMCHEVSENTQN